MSGDGGLLWNGGGGEGLQPWWCPGSSASSAPRGVWRSGRFAQGLGWCLCPDGIRGRPCFPCPDCSKQSPQEPGFSAGGGLEKADQSPAGGFVHGGWAAAAARPAESGQSQEAGF